MNFFTRRPPGGRGEYEIGEVNIREVYHEARRVRVTQGKARMHEMIKKFNRFSSSPLPSGEVDAQSAAGEGNKTSFAQKLRTESTDVERILWYRLRNRRLLGYKFRRQECIGKYIVDFVCIEKMLIIELDGGQHAENIDYDLERTKNLKKLGYRVIRFWNNEVLTNLHGVLECVLQHLSG